LSLTSTPYSVLTYSTNFAITVSLAFLVLLILTVTSLGIGVVLGIFTLMAALAIVMASRLDEVQSTPPG